MQELKKINGELNAFSNISTSVDKFPFSVKDNICVKNVETTASSKILKGYIPPFNATVVERMLEKKFGFLGKTNMDEFGFGSFGTNNENVARNPFNNEYVAGGSSSGAAIATSILKYHVAIAESTGGSIATPAAFCGVTGFVPTYGTVSRYGLIDYANSLDKIGIMARSIDDVKITYDTIKGPDRYDATCTDNKIGNHDNKKIFIIDQMLDGVEENVRSHFDNFISKMENEGYAIEEKSVDVLDKAIASYYIVAMAEASTNLAKYTGFKYGFKNEQYGHGYNRFFTEARNEFGKEAKRRIVLGTLVRSASVKDKYYIKALKIRRIMLNELNKLLSGGFIASPVMPMLTPRIDDSEKLNPVEVYKMDKLTIPPNLCGLPHVSFPIAYRDSMPIGVQVMTSQFNDYAIMDFAKIWEEKFEYKYRYNIGEL